MAEIKNCEFKDEKWLSELLGVSVSTIQKWRSRNATDAPPNIRVGGAVRYHEPTVKKWLIEQSSNNDRLHRWRSDKLTDALGLLYGAADALDGGPDTGFAEDIRSFVLICAAGPDMDATAAGNGDGV